MTATAHDGQGLISLLWSVQQGRCFHCHQPMSALGTSTAPDKASRDHVYPKSSTGRGMMNNIVLAHRSCNTERGATPPTAAQLARVRDLYAQIGETPFLVFGSVADREAMLLRIVDRATAWRVSIADLLPPAERERFLELIATQPD